VTWEAGRSARSTRLPTDWRSTVARILARDHGICHVCHQPGADQVDHIIAGDNHDDSNLAAIHGNPCHRIKSAREGGTAARIQRGTVRRPPEQHPGLRR
jgi:5-methylcytosine-specific restriction protein A